MGYDDTNLNTEILSQVDGDIEKALDILLTR
jgi:hypothetical protein